LKTLIVTGGSRGIGAATARLAGQRGYAVCVNYLRDRAAAEEVAGAIQNAIAAQADVGLEAEVVKLFETVDREGIRVNAVRPGFIYTGMHAKGGEPERVDRVKTMVPMQRGGQPEEVAASILWLLSEEASFITGTILDVSGGR
jgi:NAD(P)-dependent dehydrogenase (short-subunit alcohol dehydrogenase family)